LTNAIERNLLVEAAVERSVEAFVVEAGDDFRVLEVGVFLEEFLQIERDQRGHPPMAVDDVRCPGQFADGL